MVTATSSIQSAVLPQREIPRHKQRCSILKVLSVAAAAIAILASGVFVNPLANTGQAVPRGIPISTSLAAREVLARPENERDYRSLPCHPRMKKVVVFTEVQGGRGDVAAAGKVVDLVRKICPDATIDWVLSDARFDQYNPKSFLENYDSSKIEVRDWRSQPIDRSPADFLIAGPAGGMWGLDYVESRMGRMIEGPVFTFMESGSEKERALQPPRDPSRLVEGKYPKGIAMGLQADSGVFLDRSRIEAPRLREYGCPSYLSQIEDMQLKKDIFKAMKASSRLSSPEYDRYSFNSGYAHWPASWAKYIDAVAIHEKVKDVIIVLNQHGEFKQLSTGDFRDQIFTPERLSFLKSKGYGRVKLKGAERGTIVLQREAGRCLTVIVRPSFSPKDMKRMQLASERLLATGDNSAAEAWASRCKLYLYEDVANLGCKWRFLQQQVDLAQSISPNLAKLVALFCGDERMDPRPSPTGSRNKEKMNQM